jgi:integrase/recombinase XerD
MYTNPQRMRYSVRVLTYISRKRENKHGLAPVWCRITVKTKREDFSTGVWCKPQLFKNGRIRGNLAENLIHNIRLDNIRTRIAAFHLDLELKNLPVTAKGLKELFFGSAQVNVPIEPQQETKAVTLLTVFKNYITEIHKPVYELKKSTLKVYRRNLSNIGRYLGSIGNTDFPANEVNHIFAEDFTKWLKTKEKKCSHNYCNKQVKFLKQVLKHAEDHSIIEKNKLSGIRLKFKKVNLIFLQEWEVEKVYTYNYRSTEMRAIGDMFVLQCFTGMAYNELTQINESHITRGKEYDYIKIERGKTGVISLIPILPIAAEILSRYKFPLPVISNQKYNEYLKLVADWCEIKIRLTTHVGRKTCGCILLNRGMSIEAVSRILGHSTIRQTQNTYAVVMERRINAELKQLDLNLFPTHGDHVPVNLHHRDIIPTQLSAT